MIESITIYLFTDTATVVFNKTITVIMNSSLFISNLNFCANITVLEIICHQSSAWISAAVVRPIKISFFSNIPVYFDRDFNVSFLVNWGRYSIFPIKLIWIFRWTSISIPFNYFSVWVLWSLHKHSKKYSSACVRTHA